MNAEVLKHTLHDIIAFSFRQKPKDDVINIHHSKRNNDAKLFSEVTHRKHMSKTLSSLICRHYKADRTLEQYDFHDDAKKQLHVPVCVQSDRL